MGVIEVSNLVKKYKKSKTNAVDGISFQVNKGEFFAFLGPNGAGKTTTISILTTTLSETSGKATIAGYDTKTQSSSVRGEIGVIFQNPSLDENLTAEENIRFHVFLYKMYRFRPSYSLMPIEYRDSVIELSEVLGIKDEIFKPVKSFSGGMKRKLEIMRTLMHKPKVLFLDEPTSGLDPLSRRNLWTYLKHIRDEESTTIFLTTHYLEEAEDADRVCIINNGKIIMNDTPYNMKNSLLKDYMYVESDSLENIKQKAENAGHKYEVEGRGLKIYIKNTHVQKFIGEIDSTLTKIRIVQPTLEEAYLDLLENEND